MQSHITIHFISAIIKLLNNDQLALLTTLPLHWIQAKLYSLPNGQAIVQSLSHYLAHMEFFDCSFNKASTFAVTVNQSSFFMFIMLNGNSAFTDSKGNIISETMGNCCTISYIPKGKYQRTFYAGKHKMLLLTFREDYFIRKCTARTSFKTLLPLYPTRKKHHVLPHCTVAESIFSIADKLFVKKAGLVKIDVAIYGFIEDCLEKYHEALQTKRYDTNTVHKIKTDEIEHFIKQNYTEKFADDLPKLANRFNLSPRTANRLIKKQFGMPLHDYIVTLRMQQAMEKLSTTQRTVKDIAAEVGYSDPFYFSKVFKKYYKIAPSEVKRP